MAGLRLRLAEIQNKEGQLDALIAQFRIQARRLPRQAVYGKVSLEASLAALGEIEERLADAVVNRRRLLVIKKTCEEELEALELVQRIDEAKRALADLRKRVRASGTDEISRQKCTGWSSLLPSIASGPSGRSPPAIRSDTREPCPGTNPRDRVRGFLPTG